jgi:hypothetical protein
MKTYTVLYNVGETEKEWPVLGRFYSDLALEETKPDGMLPLVTAYPTLTKRTTFGFMKVGDVVVFSRFTLLRRDT